MQGTLLHCTPSPLASLFSKHHTDLKVEVMYICNIYKKQLNTHFKAQLHTTKTSDTFTAHIQFCSLCSLQQMPRYILEGPQEGRTRGKRESVTPQFNQVDQKEHLCTEPLQNSLSTWSYLQP